MSIRFEIENVSGYDSELHHDAIMTELEMNNPASFADEMLNSVSKLVQLPSTWIENADVEMQDGYYHVECADSPDCDFDPDGVEPQGDCGCYMFHGLDSVYCHANLTILDGYQVEIEFDTAHSSRKAEIRYNAYDCEVILAQDTVDAINEYYQDTFDNSYV